MIDSKEKSSKNPFSLRKRVLIITGPTASGKSSIAEYIASEYFGEIISADSCQIYKKLDIGTAKPQNPQVPYHLIDFLDLGKRYDAKSFFEDTENIIGEIIERNNFPLICGGTGFYIRALTEGIFKGDFKDIEFRNRYMERYEKGDDLHSELKAVDPIAASKIHPNNYIRIIRALEVYHVSGKPISWQWKNRKPIKSKYDFVKIAIRLPRDYLRKRIFERTKKMFQAGWLDEVKSLLSEGTSPDCPAMESVGYKQIIDYLNDKLKYDELVENVFHKTWQYSRRQMVWLRKEPNLIWIDINEDMSIKEKADKILDIYMKD
ncbi:MAG: tRNA (adenosine(37)-N6)-dimethylallyltransferase MiaA [Candidatus Zixiibacteriota bacterium]